MLRAHLNDAALAAAKAWSHARVERRHIGYAIARHFRSQPEVAELLPRARQALEPRGTAHEVPTLTDEANALLDSISSQAHAIAALRAMLDDSTEASGEGSTERTQDSAPPSIEVAEGAPPQESASAPTTETVGEILAELDQLVGLETVKVQVRSVIAVVQANQARAEAGHPTVNPGLHLVFSGPPGTGKTTVARLMARLYAASGALPGNNFTEVGRSDLVGGYVGQTALKTTEMIKRTVPGVLFIDEAYSLTPTHASDYGAEAIATLVKAMEDQRDRLAVIVAGYAKEMATFLESNPGLRSRLKTFIGFPSYGPAELSRIFAGFVNATGLRLQDRALEKAEDLFRRATEREDFGNARFARSLFEQAYARMALRAAEDGTLHVDELMELTAEDLEWANPGVDVDERRIGFGVDEEEEEDEP